MTFREYPLVVGVSENLNTGLNYMSSTSRMGHTADTLVSK